MKIVDLVCSAGRTGFYFDDQRAIKGGAGHDGIFYVGAPVTEGFTAVRQAGESISVMLILEDGQIAYGDCAAVQYSGAGGRDPLFLAKDFIPLIEKHIKPQLVGKEANDFRGLCAMMEAIQVDGKRLHTAIRYGVSQAILDAVAKATGRLMCEVVADEYGCTVSDKPLNIFTQSGDDRYSNADKMIIKGAQVLPHALINNVEEKLGKNGEKLAEYVAWLRDRILNMRLDENYNPVIHIDVYGTIGAAMGNHEYKKMADYIEELGKIAKPLHLRIEGPMDCDSTREEQIEALSALTAELDARGCDVELVADEWCNTLEDIKLFADKKAGHMVQIKTPDLGGVNNTIEAVLYCKEKGIGAYQGGTCNETDRSCQVCVNCAMATQPDQILAKPGMGVDEGFMIVYNEMNRILALRNAKAACKCSK
ncbi:MAG: methylaspartate ammonia-lyase [Clostridia bacterium]|nr:methylaspartate ammonia-lyase [Clostridia bacterium]